MRVDEVSTVLNYLLNLIQAEEVSNMARLAALSVLNKLFSESDNDCEIQAFCLRKGIVSSLVLTLDIGFLSTCDSSDLVYICVAMETMWRLSTLPGHMMQPLISEFLIRRLLTYIDVEGDFFMFPSKLATIMEEICENKQLIAKVKEVGMAPEPLEYIHRHTKNKLKSLPRFPHSLKVCSLFDTSHKEDVNISKQLIDQNLAWPGLNIPGDVVRDSKDVWQDILVTKVIGGAFMWAQVGEETIKDVCAIQQQLNSGIQLERQLVLSSKDLVVVRTEIQGTSSLLRAQIMSTTCYGSTTTDVFLIDYGHLVTVQDKNVYIMPEDLKVIPQKVSLCALEGIQAPPKDEELCINAAAVLANIAKQGFPSAGEIICELEGIAVMERFLKSVNKPALVIPVLTVLANLGRGRKLCGEFIGSRIMNILLEMLGEYTEKEGEGDSKHRTLVESCVTCLTNILHKNPDCREKFYQCQESQLFYDLEKRSLLKTLWEKKKTAGLDIVLQFLTQKVRVNSTVYFATLKLLKVFVGSAINSKDTEKVSSRPQQRITEPAVREENNQTVSPSRCVNKAEVRISDTLDEDVVPNTDRLVPEHVSRFSLDKSPPYVLGSCVYISDDQKHEIHPIAKVENISSSVIAQIVCGMLNSGGGGIIYCGIDKEGIVFGLELSRDEKDRFRRGVDQLMSGKINPTLLHFNFEFKAVPILNKDKQYIIPDLFVIEIRVKAARGVTYTTNEDQCFYRYGAATNPLTKQEVRKLVAVEEEDNYRAEIERLIERKKKLGSV